MEVGRAESENSPRYGARKVAISVVRATQGWSSSKVRSLPYFQLPESCGAPSSTPISHFFATKRTISVLGLVAGASCSTKATSSWPLRTVPCS